MLSFVWALATFLRKRLSLPLTCDFNSASSSSTSSRAYHTSSLRIRARSCMASRYDDATAMLTALRSESSNPRSRPATAKLAASRLTSHSKGPGKVSSKSLRLKTSLRSGAAKEPEVRQVRVPAQLNVQARARRTREVCRHQIGGAAVEREGRHQHPAVAERDQLGHAAGPLLLEEVDRVCPVGRRLPLAVHPTRRQLSRRPARLGPLLRCQPSAASQLPGNRGGTVRRQGLARVHDSMGAHEPFVCITQAG